MSRRTTRNDIVEAADDLFYRQGYGQTSFSDIADVVNISRGNFYHHFKTKDEILDAVIEARLAKTRDMLDGWERAGAGPEERIQNFIDILVANWREIKLYGCPVGTLSSELAKLDHPAQGEAKRLFTLFRRWLARQFAELGRADDADDLAMHLLARSQGVAMLANAFRNKAFVTREVDEMHAWVRANSRRARGGSRRKRAAGRA